MKALGISTASKYTGAALVENGVLSSEFTVQGMRSEDLTLLLNRIMEESGQEIKQVQAICVASGPGSYSGLRGGMAAAKSLAQVLDVPIIGVSALEAMAFNLIENEGTIAAVMDAVRGEVNLALFTCKSKSLRRITDDIVISEKEMESFLSKVQGKLLVATNIENLKNVITGAVFAGSLMSIPYAKNVAVIGANKLESGEKQGLLSMAPAYSHMPNVKEYSK